MENAVVLLCKRGVHTAGVILSPSLRFAGLLVILKQKWSDLNEGSFSLYYALEGHPNCILASDDDLNVLYALALSCHIGRVDVSITALGGSSRVCNSIDSCSSTLDALGCDAHDSSSTVSEEVDLLPSFACHKTKPLKSDHWVNLIRGVGQEFPGGVVEFRDSLCQFSLYHGFKFFYERNDGRTVKATCSVTGCEWSIKAKLQLSNGSFKITEFVDVHKCGAAAMSTSSSRASSNMIGRLVSDLVRSTPSKRALDVLHELKDEYGVDVSYRKAWLAMQKARGNAFGDYGLSFSDLAWFVDAFRSSNPASCCDVERDDGGRFLRLFLGFDACRHGFQFCRSILFVDATFLKGIYKGCLLAACGKDANQGLYPVCVAVVNAENSENWLWFMGKLKTFFEWDRDVVFMSDRNLGLLQAIRTIFPSSPHSFCLVHLKANLRKHLGGVETKHKNHLIGLFNRAAYALNVVIFDNLIAELKEGGGDKVISFLTDLPNENWCHAHFPGKRWGELTSNLVESFNNWIKVERHLPVTQLLDCIRLKLMEQMSNRRVCAMKWNGVCPAMDKKLAAAFNFSRSWTVTTSHANLFEVRCNPSVSVDIGLRTCSCGEWQINSFPCVHVVCALKKSGKNLNEYVDRYYLVDMYREAYSKCINPVPTLSKADFVPTSDMVLLPPLTKRPPGRPRTERIPSMGFRTRKVTCSRCGKLGHHNKASCKEPLNH